MNTINVKTRIIPEIFIYNNIIRKITRIGSEFIIKEFDIILNEDLTIHKVILKNGKHPHCNPSTNEYCIPEKLKNKKFNELLYSFLVSSFSIINGDSSRYIPIGDMNLE